ncbi:carbon-nitrogen family hydrolase [Blastococcus sp. SYSU D00820]
MDIGLAQVSSPPEESPERRRERVGELLATLPDVDLIVLPELWAAGYFSFEQYPQRAETLAGPTVELARATARERGCFVHLGSIVERGEGDRLFNTAVLVDPQGELALTYRKIHVFGYQSLEAQLLTPGDAVGVRRTDRLGAVGTTTCYDLRFPELWRDLVDLGAELVVVPAAWPMRRLEHWRLFTSCRAVEEQVFVVACNSAGTQAGDVQLAGHSRVVDPWGSVLFEAGADEQVAVVPVDLQVVADIRGEFPVLGDRRRRSGALPGAYGSQASPTPEGARA